MGIFSRQHIALTKELLYVWESPFLQTTGHIWKKTKRQTGEKGNTFVLRMICQMNFGDLEIRKC